MSKQKKAFYLILKGHCPGVYSTWEGAGGAKAQVAGYPNAIYKGFYTAEEAYNWLKSQTQETLPQSLQKWLDDQEKAMTHSSSNPLKSTIQAHLQAGGTVIFTDGSAFGNPGPGGYAAVILTNHQRREIHGGFRLTTNNRMELYACIAALETLQTPTNVYLITDSTYVYRAVHQGWLQRWAQNGWKRRDGKAIENRDLWQRLNDLHQQHRVVYTWIKGHNATLENERCDHLAASSAKAPNLPEDPGYRVPRASSAGTIHPHRASDE